MEELKYFVALNTHQKIGPITFKKLLDYFGDLEKVWKVKQIDLKKAGLTEEQIKAIIEIRKKVDPDKELEKIKKLGLFVMTIKDKNYPKLLKEIYDPPSIIYYKGKIFDDDLKIAIVGSRACTSYGRRVAENLAFDLASEGITIVSGLALGIDSVAHKAALDAKGKTIAVLGNGLDRIYPDCHRKLAKDILENEGAIISEFSPGTPPYRGNFPQRNRVISGLSQGTIVVEAIETSGALITAKSALEQNREVFAVPGNIDSPSSKGTNNLIKMGAHPITQAADVLIELNIKPKSKGVRGLRGVRGVKGKEEKLLFSLLSSEPLHIDKLKEKSKLDVALVNSTLIMLEMKGLIKNIGGGYYIRI